MPIDGVPLLVRVIENVKTLDFVDDIIVVTSSLRADDPISAVCTQQDVNCFRGDENDVLSRFVHSIERYSTTDVVLRFTGDNPFLATEAACEGFSQFVKSNVDYLALKLCPVIPEFVRVEALRSLSSLELSDQEKEHVTLGLQCRQERFTVAFLPESFYNINASINHLLTVDTMDDLVRVESVCQYLRQEHLPESLENVYQCLYNKGFCPAVKRNAQLVLGTAQFGLKYGISNTEGKVSGIELDTILNFARNNGLPLDTAPAYGDAETVIGNFFRASPGNKVPIFTKLSPDVTSNEVESQVMNSIAALGVQVLDICLVHSFQSYLDDPKVISELIRLKKKGTISKIGFSLYYPREAVLLVEKAVPIDIIQVPYSVFDQRFEEVFDLVLSKNIEIHARSVFLQGLFFLPDQKLSVQFPSIMGRVEKLKNIAKMHLLSLADVLLGFVALNTRISAVVIGVQNFENLKENWSAFNAADKLWHSMDKLRKLNLDDERVLLPFLWDKRGPFSLERKTVVITGGYGHLGSAIVLCLTSAGANVVVFARDKRKFLEKFSNIPQVHFIECDVSSSTSIRNSFQSVKESFGRLDALINNAFYSCGSGAILTDDEWKFGIDGTLSNVYRCIREATPFVEESRGKIINVSSMYGVVAPDMRIYSSNPEFTNPAHYGAAKAGVIHLTRYFASYLGSKGITVNCVSPGPFPSTPVQKHPEFVKALESKTLLRRIGQPEELAGIFVYLCSDASAYMTGQNICVDGGWTVI